MMPIETIGFGIEKMRKIVSCPIGGVLAGFCLPSASNQPIWPRRATIMVTPGVVPLAMSRLKASDIRCSRRCESPSDSGFAWGSGGVCGAGVCFAAVCAVMVSPVLLLSFAAVGQRLLLGVHSSLAQNTPVEQRVFRNEYPRVCCRRAVGYRASWGRRIARGRRLRPCNRGVAYA